MHAPRLSHALWQKTPMRLSLRRREARRLLIGNLTVLLGPLVVDPTRRMRHGQPTCSLPVCGCRPQNLIEGHPPRSRVFHCWSNLGIKCNASGRRGREGGPHGPRPVWFKAMNMKMKTGRSAVSATASRKSGAYSTRMNATPSGSAIWTPHEIQGSILQASGRCTAAESSHESSSSKAQKGVRSTPATTRRAPLTAISMIIGYSGVAPSMIVTVVCSVHVVGRFSQNAKRSEKVTLPGATRHSVSPTNRPNTAGCGRGGAGTPCTLAGE